MDRRYNTEFVYLVAVFVAVACFRAVFSGGVCCRGVFSCSI